MRSIIQRVSHCSVDVNQKVVGKIGQGYLILLGIESEDSNEDVEWLANKIVALRIFSDEKGLMNKSIIDVDGSVLVVSQFTLHAKYKKGTRPSFIRAAKPEQAIPLYEAFCKELENLTGKVTQTGEFGADMDVHLTNDGPVTIIIDTKNKE
ncbi:D-aminoacyl-tRNA deacylase [Salibacteraceae bacterium]|jgi:D-aminoacyl-tRNA deacylase|nr:D-aminoacyl-tRNA deacylase [Salibacteraceae bacterium]MDB4104033.1 D-aminoacyl-tRNA deacylase [Salibacteraceae bacterium]MDB9709229.1 D-aminoacyl-tRNA deacylase [Salibacteraceae bacterium]MDC1304592.1 D-aminoacyl-tRNA deacylase [Salibacteraceae bacterium]HAQ71972.1 D-tyrosyl-tRNA(Tyr) deacylase [Flavobacteriales bacterium]